MVSLFEPLRIGSLELANRVVRSATWEGLATPEGAVTPGLVSAMVRLAEGGVGLIVSGHAYVARVGQAGPRQLGAYSDDLLPGLRQMAAAVHATGGHMVLQLAHAGGRASRPLTGQEPAGPSVMRGQQATTREECRDPVPSPAGAASPPRAPRSGARVEGRGPSRGPHDAGTAAALDSRPVPGGPEGQRSSGGGAEAGPPPPVPSGGQQGEALCREMTEAEIQGTVAEFARAAARAREAGFDGVQVHAAHGYLLSQFLSPHTNQRTDAFGGSLTNRLRLPLAVYAAVRGAVGPDYPVLAKVNADDYLADGFTATEMLELVGRLRAVGLDAVELSGGTPDSGNRVPVRRGRLPKPSDEVYYRVEAGRLRAAVAIPLIVVGGIRSFGVAQELVESGAVDAVAMCRPLIREPDLPRRWRSGDTTRTGCLSCNLCFKPMHEGTGFFCPVAQRQAARPAQA